MKAQNCKSKVSQSFFMMNIIQQQEKITIQESDKLEKLTTQLQNCRLSKTFQN